MPFIFETLWYSFCACVRNILTIVTFVIEKMKLASLSLFLDAPPPQTQDALWTIKLRYTNI